MGGCLQRVLRNIQDRREGFMPYAAIWIFPYILNGGLAIRMKQLNNKNFTPKIPYFTSHDAVASNEDVLSISKRLIEKNKESYEVLAR